MSTRLAAALLLLGAAVARAATVEADAGRALPEPAHDYALRAYTAAMQGRKAATLAAVQDVVGVYPLEAARARGDSGWSLTQQYAALVRFGLWDEMIALEPPASGAGAAGLSAGYLYGRGFALAARGRAAEAQRTLDQMQALASALPAEAMGGVNTLRELLAVAQPVVAARIAASAGDDARAVELLQQAVVAEDRLAHDAPSDWFFPVRQLLGAQLLLAGQPQEAEKVYREDLRRNLSNGWSLYGLALALAREGRTAEASRVRHEQQLAWTHADVALPASAFWYAGADTASCECEHRALGNGQAGRKLLRAQHEAGVD
jgi:tetratricopeptide (TPR) repeat protein